MPFDTKTNLKAVQRLLAPIVRWSVRLGIGYRQFSRMIEPLFFHFQSAQEDLVRQNLKCSDSSLSLTGGLHKGDIAFFRDAQQDLFEDTYVVRRGLVRDHLRACLYPPVNHAPA